MALSGELGKFIDYVGGPEWGHVLLSPLENLAAIEEPVVRDKVGDSDAAFQDRKGYGLTSAVSRLSSR